MLEVFQNHEKRKSEDGGSSERSHHITHMSSNPTLLSSVRIGSQVPPRTTNKLPSELHHPPTMPMQLASNVMVVPPQQIATSSSHQALLNSFHKRKGFPLAVAHPIVRQNPNYNAAVAHSMPQILPHKTKVVAHTANTPHSQDSPLDLSAPLDLSIKRKKDSENDDLNSQNVLKRQRTSEAQNGKGDHIMTPKRNCSEILSKPPPIYPGLRAPHMDHYANRQQRRVHPLVQERSQNQMDRIHHQCLELKAKGKDMTTEEKLRFARKAFAIQSARILERNGSPSYRHVSPPHKEARLPVKRAQMAVPPLLTAGVSSSRPLTPNDPVPVYVMAQQFSERSRLVNEEKKLLARAAAMGIPVEQDSPRPQRSPHLIKENGTVDAEMEEALRKMMMRSTTNQPSPPLSTGQTQHVHRSSLPQQPEIDKRLLEKFAYCEYMKRQMLLGSRQESSQVTARGKSSSPSSLSTQSPPLPSARPTSHLERQEDLKRRLFYEMHLRKNLKQASSCIHPLTGSFSPQSPPQVGVRIGEGSSKKVPCSSYQYKFSPKDMAHRQSPSLVPQDGPKKESSKEDLKSCEWLLRNHLDTKPREYHREYQKMKLQNTRQNQEVQPQDSMLCTPVGPTASRGPISQGLPHPISQKTQKASTSVKTPHFFNDHVKRDPVEKLSTSAASSSFRNRKNLLNPEKARDHILASMNPTLRDLFQGKDQEKQKQLFRALRENHNMHIQRTKGFAINFRDMIAHQISKCIDESSDSSEVIDLTNDTSESPSLGDNEKKAIASQKTGPHSFMPMVREGHKKVVVKNDPPPLIKVTDSKAQFVPLTSDSVIQSGSITQKQPGKVSIGRVEENSSPVRVHSKPTPEMKVIMESKKLENVKLEPEENIKIKREVDVQEETDFEKLTASSNLLQKTENKDDYVSSDPGSSNFQKSSKIELPEDRSEFLVNSSSAKSVSYDPRRRILAALNERLKTALLSSHEPPKEVILNKTAEDEEVKAFTDTKIIARADQDDKECKLPDQLLEDDDDEDGDKTEEEQEATPKADEKSETKTEAVSSAPLVEEACEEIPKQKRRRKRRVRRYYHIAPRRTSSRKVTKRRPPQVRKPLAPSKPKFADFAPEVLQMRTRNSDGRRRQAAMASSYHRDTRYEQEIEKEQQKVMERRRRRTAVLQSTTQQSRDGNEMVDEERDEMENQHKPARRFEENTAVGEEKEKLLSATSEDQTEDVISETRQSTEGQERYFFGAQYDLKVRIQKKHLVKNFPSREKKWQALKSSAKMLREKKSISTKSLGKKNDTQVVRLLERNRPSTSGLFSMQLNGLPKRRKQTKVRNKLLKARIMPSHHTMLRPSVPPPPRELKRLAVNKKLGETLLHKAARLGHDDSALYCISYCTQDINAKDNAGYTPLHECCVNGRLRVAKHMIANGADVNGSAADGTRPVHDAIDNEKVELARLLLAHGADPLIATYSGRTTRKLARSKETKTLIYGYLKDINGCLLAPQEELENLQKLNLNIRFHSSFQTAEEWTNSGTDFMDGAPEPTLENEEVMFEISDKPLLPSFGLFIKECKRFGNWLLLSDVLQRLGMTRADFLYRHRDVTVYSINRNDMESSVQNGISQVKGIMGKTTGKSVELVELDDHIRGILGSEKAFI